MNRFRLTKKGMIALSLLLLLLVGAIALNISLNARSGADSPQANAEDGADESGTDGRGDGAKTVSANVYSGFFTGFREERANIRAQEIDYLRLIIADESTDAETLANAQQRLMRLVSDMEQEFTIESRIRAKGFLDAAVTFRNDSITVVVDAESLTDQDVARILDIVRTETGAPASAIRITLSRQSAQNGSN